MALKSSPFRFHEGEALLKLAGAYPRILDVLFEETQNGVDKDSQLILITINQKARQIVIRDDGEGVNQAEFEKALTSVASSIKKKDKLGRFGIGLISPLGKCSRFTFTSTPKNDPRSYLEWSFVTEDLRVQDKIAGIPMRPRPDLQFERNENVRSRSVTGVPWRTEVKIENYTADSQINRVSLESLREGILDRFGAAMRRNKTVVRVTITDESGEKKTEEIRAKQFEGVKLQEIELQEKDSGRTSFKLYRAKKTEKGRKGKVFIGETHNEFRLSFTAFNSSLPEVCALSDEVVAAFNSGFFEGEILNNRVKLHTNRRAFELDDALAGFCITIEQWFETHGYEQYKEVKVQQQEEKYQQLGIRSMKVIEDLLKQPSYAGLLKAIETFKKGTIGKGHTEHKGQPTPFTGVSVHGNLHHSIGNGYVEQAKRAPATEREGHRPMIVAGPKGSKRVIVRGNSLGLLLIHDTMPGSDTLWALDQETGAIKINVLHPLWQKCEEHSDKTLMRFQEYLMLQALGLQSSPGDWSQYARLVLDELNSPYVYMLINGDSIAGRQGGRPKKEVKV